MIPKLLIIVKNGEVTVKLNEPIEIIVEYEDMLYKPKEIVIDDDNEEFMEKQNKLQCKN